MTRLDFLKPEERRRWDEINAALETHKLAICHLAAERRLLYARCKGREAAKSVARGGRS